MSSSTFHYHDGTERDNKAEAVMCAMAMATDEIGRLLGSVPLEHAVQLGRAVAEHIEEYGYRLVKIEPPEA